MTWGVVVSDEFEREFADLPPQVQDEIAALVRLLSQYGPNLKRPYCDTLKGSRYANMKELRFRAVNGVWRIAFAFDSSRRAILLAAGSKSGISEQRFYRALVRAADERFANHLERMKGQ